MSSPWLARIPPAAVTLRFVRSSGPGGQNVNKVASAVQLRVDLEQTQLPNAMLDRLRNQCSHLLVGTSELLIHAERHRTQARNRADAWDRLGDALDRAAIVPRKRIPTKPTYGSKQKRRAAKELRASTKRTRRPPGLD